MKEILSSNSVSLQDLFSSRCCYFYKMNLLAVYRTHVSGLKHENAKHYESTKLISGRGGLCCINCDVVTSLSN